MVGATIPVIIVSSAVAQIQTLLRPSDAVGRPSVRRTTPGPPGGANTSRDIGLPCCTSCQACARWMSPAVRGTACARLPSAGRSPTASTSIPKPRPWHVRQTPRAQRWCCVVTAASSRSRRCLFPGHLVRDPRTRPHAGQLRCRPSTSARAGRSAAALHSERQSHTARRRQAEQPISSARIHTRRAAGRAGAALPARSAARSGTGRPLPHASLLGGSKATTAHGRHAGSTVDATRGTSTPARGPRSGEPGALGTLLLPDAL